MTVNLTSFVLCEPLVGVCSLLVVRHTLGEFSGSVHSFSEAACGTGGLLPEKENHMKYDKNLQFCMNQLRFMQERDGLEPEQRSALEKAKIKLKRLRRNSKPSRREIFETIREIAEAIINNFVLRN